MANIIIQENGSARTRPAVHGEEITIQAPCNCSEVTGVQIADTIYSFYDAMGNSLEGIRNLFAKDSLIKVLIDTVQTRAILLSTSCELGTNISITPSFLGKMFGRFYGQKFKPSFENTNYYTRLAYGNGLWVFVGPGITYYSEDGKTWEIGTEDADLSSVSRVDSANGLWVLVDSSGGAWWSEGGKTWTKSETGLICNSIEYANGLWVVGSKNRGAWWSEDGKTWTQVSGSMSTKTIDKVAYGNGLWVLVDSSGGAWWSESGKTWTKSDSTNVYVDENIRNSLVYANGLWVVVSGNYCHWSEDGKTWTRVQAGGSNYSVVYANGLWVLGAGPTITHGDTSGGLYYSENGKTWTKSSASRISGTESFQTVAYANGLWLACCDSGLYRSEDGKTWTKNDFTGSLTIRDITYANGLWVANFYRKYVGYSGYEEALENGALVD